jgi:hypothetical protein
MILKTRTLAGDYHYQLKSVCKMWYRWVGSCKCRKFCYQQQSGSQSECQFQPVEVIEVTSHCERSDNVQSSSEMMVRQLVKLSWDGNFRMEGESEYLVE